MTDLEDLAEELRDLPRHRWDSHLWRYCERLVAEARRRAPGDREPPAPERDVGP